VTIQSFADEVDLGRLRQDTPVTPRHFSGWPNGALATFQMARHDKSTNLPLRHGICLLNELAVDLAEIETADI